LEQLVKASTKSGQNAIADAIDKLYRDKKIPTKRTQATYDGAVDHERKEERAIKIRSTPVAWAIPFDEVTYSKFIVNLLNLRMMPWDDILTSQSTYLPDARNINHRNFVQNSSSPWLVMLDSDVLPPPDFLERLLAHKKKMVGGWYRKKGEPYGPVVYDRQGFDDEGIPAYVQREKPGEGLECVDGAGAGCWLMHRAVAEAIGIKPYNMNEGGEDLTLCRKVQEAGYKIYIDWSIACAHTGVAIV